MIKGIISVVIITGGFLVLVQCADKGDAADPMADQSTGGTNITSQSSIQNPIFKNTTAAHIELVTNSKFNPSFAWEHTGAAVLVLAVFNDKIAVDKWNMMINNPQDVVWMWTSDFGSGRDGQVEWLHGQDVSGGIPQPGTPQILPNDVYYYGLWGFDSSGELAWSSIEYQYIYTN